MSGVADNYNKINFKLCAANGYIDRFGYDERNDFVFLPTRAIGSSAIAPNDHFNQNNALNGWAVCDLGGHCCDNAKAGLWCLNVNKPIDNHNHFVGARIAFCK